MQNGVELTVLIFDLLPICLVYARIAGSLYRANKAANVRPMISHCRVNCTLLKKK